MNLLNLNHFRTVLIIAVVACSIYLYWWGLSDDFAIVRMATEGQNGYGITEHLTGKIVEHKQVKDIAVGWLGIKSLFPQLFSVILIIMATAFFIAEQIVNICNKKNYEKVVLKAEEIENSATLKLTCCCIFARKHNLEIEDIVDLYSGLGQ